MMNERAVSEAIGFILILGIVTTGIGLVTLYGYPVLLKEQSNTDVKSMERAMIIIQNDMKSLCFKNVPYKETALQVSGGTLELINSSSYGGYINVSIETEPEPYSYPLGALTYRADRSDEVITLENGAVMVRQDFMTGSAMLAEPRWFYDEPTKTFVIYIMNITSDQQMAKTGMGAVRMGRISSTTKPIPLSYGDTVTIEYKPGSAGNYSTAWENYLTDSSIGLHLDGYNKYKRDDVVRLVIKEYEIKIHDI